MVLRNFKMVLRNNYFFSEQNFWGWNCLTHQRLRRNMSTRLFYFSTFNFYFSRLLLIFSVLLEMGLFGSSSPFDPLLDKATNEQATSEDWSLILSICDKARASSKNGKDCLSAITKKLGHRVPRVALQGMSDHLINLA